MHNTENNKKKTKFPLIEIWVGLSMNNPTLSAREHMGNQRQCMGLSVGSDPHVLWCFAELK